MNDEQLTALRAAIRQALVECYASHAAMLRGLAREPGMGVMDGPGALEAAANVIERAMVEVRDAG